MSRSLFKATSLVGGMTFLSRILGFARDVVLARYFGAGAVMDAFFVAFKIPNFLRRTFGEGAFSLAFVPVISEYKTTREHDEVKELADRVAGSLGLVLLVVTVIGVIAAPVLVWIFAPGFSVHESKYELTVAMVRITFPYLLFISLTAFAGGILNTYGRFGVPAFTPVLLNIILIAAAIWLAPHMHNPGMALAWGVFIAGVVQLAFQMPFLLRLKLMPRPRLSEGHEAVRRILKLMLPALFGSSVTQINLVVDTIIASFLATGSVSWLYYSDRLMEFPLGVFSIALSTVILPTLAQQFAAKSSAGFSATLDWALRLAVVVAIPAAVGLFFLAGPLLVTLFNYGHFNAYDSRMAQASLMAYAIGLMGFTLVKVFSPGFYARQDSRTPVKIGVISVVANIVLNLIITIPWAMSGLAAPHAGLALSTSLAAFINAWLLYHGLRRTQAYQPAAGWPLLWRRVLIANAVMALLLWVLVRPLHVWLERGASQRVLWLAIWIVAAIVVYFAALFLGGFRLQHLRRAPVS
ncbi:MAG: murein biosynthesis integral membrane protein MurJ [Gammaproteobacteria bacterium]|nr:murein biosynthesis integral membrane protein MurJ [Gammaproteobacteria bacterium]MDE1984714.1 murein biosynthesis integral membrane protein MurJ [Gammaproteobacteria bacterium]MDE2109437.1 murein biosynthesis integral membrane protein MurJ [Gammaproteobacteria bacterium]MDE2459879.1 murein biosynthesis integral membrane protein MurJ [Gammaproteobacteria bacterium]